MTQVFLSYARGDASKARIVARALQKAGHTVWWDLHLRGGEQFSKVIEEALKVSDAVVVLWSKESIESPWVRDEAATGRDKERFVPVSLDGTQPPLGFRQFQTIDLSEWTGRGKIRRLPEILNGLAETAARPIKDGMPEMGARDQVPGSRIRLLSAIAGAAALLTVVGIGLWTPIGAKLPVVKVVATDDSSLSVASADALFAKLGSLAQIGDGKWQLLDSNADTHAPDLVFKTTENSSANGIYANLLLLDGKNKSLLWSREFKFPSGSNADLRQQVALTAGRVLDCALESRDSAHLSTDLIKTFLDACASLADLSGEDYGPLTNNLREIVERVPEFKPAWSRLIMSDSTALEYSRNTPTESQSTKQLMADAEQVRTRFPTLPELAVADVQLRGSAAYGRNIDELLAAIDRSPANPFLFTQLADAYLKVGRMADAISSARKASELDPLSPGGTTTYIMTLAHGGEIETARNELKKAETLWSGTGSLRDAQLAFLVRYGDPATALKLNPSGYNSAIFYKTRSDPSPQNIAKLKAGIDEFRPKSVTPSQVGWAIQALAEFGLVDDVFYWIGRLPQNEVADISYLFFRPALASVRRDRRFMEVAKRIGLVDYWQKSGNWPDYCDRPGISYNCKLMAR